MNNNKKTQKINQSGVLWESIKLADMYNGKFLEHYIFCCLKFARLTAVFGGGKAPFIKSSWQNNIKRMVREL